MVCGTWMSSCRKRNFSFYYVNQNFFLERNYRSMRVLCWVVARNMLNVLTMFWIIFLKIIFKKKEGTTILCLSFDSIWLMNNDTILCEKVNNQNQLFRILDNCKIGGESY